MRVSIAENVELPETASDPLIMAPFDEVTADKCAELPLTITLFQVANYYSNLLISGLFSIHINMNVLFFWLIINQIVIYLSYNFEELPPLLNFGYNNKPLQFCHLEDYYHQMWQYLLSYSHHAQFYLRYMYYPVFH